MREFGRFLGFLELMPDGNYVTDPTRAIQYFLPEIFDDTHTLPAKIFMANMAEVMPMMDGGQYRNSVHDVMQQEKTGSHRKVTISAPAHLLRCNDLKSVDALSSPSTVMIKTPYHFTYLAVKFAGLAKSR